MEMALEHGKYLLIKHLNSGGYGAVYEAEDRHLNRRVAIKKTDYIAAPNEPNDQGVPVVVLREGSVLCRLQHPNVVKMHDIYMDHGQYCFVFELCNCNLRECMQELDQAGHHWMEENMLRNYLQQILSGLEYCHERRGPARRLPRRPVHRANPPQTIRARSTSGPGNRRLDCQRIFHNPQRTALRTVFCRA